MKKFFYILLILSICLAGVFTISGSQVVITSDSTTPEKKKQVGVVATSAGAGDAGKIPKLDGSGKLDSSMIPEGSGGGGSSVTNDLSYLAMAQPNSGVMGLVCTGTDTRVISPTVAAGKCARIASLFVLNTNVSGVTFSILVNDGIQTSTNYLARNYTLGANSKKVYSDLGLNAGGFILGSSTNGVEFLTTYDIEQTNTYFGCSIPLNTNTPTSVLQTTPVSGNPARLKNLYIFNTNTSGQVFTLLCSPDGIVTNTVELNYTIGARSLYQVSGLYAGNGGFIKAYGSNCVAHALYDLTPPPTGTFNIAPDIVTSSVGGATNAIAKGLQVIYTNTFADGTKQTTAFFPTNYCEMRSGAKQNLSIYPTYDTLLLTGAVYNSGAQYMTPTVESNAILVISPGLYDVHAHAAGASGLTNGMSLNLLLNNVVSNWSSAGPYVPGGSSSLDLRETLMLASGTWVSVKVRIPGTSSYVYGTNSGEAYNNYLRMIRMGP